MTAAARQRVLIVGKTRMGTGACIGAMARDGCPIGRLAPGGFCRPPPPQCPFEIGDFWDMRLRPRTALDSPHIEDHDEWDAAKVVTVAPGRLGALIRQRVQPLTGEPGELFGGRICYRDSGTGFVPRSGEPPGASVQFWITPRALRHEPFGDKHRYRMRGSQPLWITYVGFDRPAPRIPAGSLVRVSLARWWLNPQCADEGETCSLQLSGWFG